MLQIGSTISFQKNNYKLVRLLGEGGQGIVYEVTDDNKNHLALKLLFPYAVSQETKVALSEEVTQRNSPDNRFLWPANYVEHVDQFGYVMPLREARFSSWEKLVQGRVKPVPQLDTLIFACRSVCEAFFNLHIQGLVYKDLNLGGPALDTKTGEVVICDCDNVRIDNDPNGERLYFPEFAAPEVILEETTCTRYSDYHSLAVLLFYTLVRHHPYQGALWEDINLVNDTSERAFYATKPKFIFGSDHKNTLPKDTNPARNWDRLPVFMRKLFYKTFVDGAHNPKERTTDGTWVKALIKFQDNIVRCSHCKTLFCAENTDICDTCGNKLRRHCEISFDERKVLLTEGMVFQVDKHFLGNKGLGLVVNHPRKRNEIGLKNISKSSWKAYLPDKTVKNIAPTASIILMTGMTISIEGNHYKILTIN
ncbi:hypothetical protein WKI13_15320 [Teredinibacter turnerae]|uniref:protein kinase domain-containing protein n=1 Tax=Teredinibacter turnerae TaxID=2426 RepID=UPI00036C810D|nr:hypothetical protein [Teredinibacter turnerae]